MTTHTWKLTDEPFDEHPWVLLTVPRDRDSQALSAAWAEQGYEVFVCDGPQAGHSCPLVRGETCPIVDQAHLVVNGLPPTGRSSALRTALADQHPDLPVIDLG